MLLMVQELSCLSKMCFMQCEVGLINSHVQAKCETVLAATDNWPSDATLFLRLLIKVIKSKNDSEG